MKSLIQEETKTPKQNCFLKKIRKGNLRNISCHVWVFYPSLWRQRMKTAWVSNLLESRVRAIFGRFCGQRYHCNLHIVYEIHIGCLEVAYLLEVV